MKILLYGDRSPGSGGWCYAQTLREMGHVVSEFGDWHGLESYQHRPFWKAFRRLTRTVWERHRHRHVRALFDQANAFQPDLVIVLKGLHLSGEDVRGLKRAGAWVANVNHDDFFSHYPLNWSRVQREALPDYDYLFTTRAVNVAEIRPLNPNVEFFPFAYYPAIHRPEPIPAGETILWEVDVVFVGTWAAHRAWLLEELVRGVPASYAIHGGQWHKLSRHSPLRPYVRSREVVLTDMAKALGGAKIALGFLRKENRDDYTQRTFEIPACAGVLLAERTPRHLSFYREGVEAEFFDPDSPDELVAKVRQLLADPDRRESMRAAGQEALLSQKHTYRDRLERLFELYAQAHSASIV